MDAANPSVRRPKTLFVYLLMLGGTVAAFQGVRSLGAGLLAPAPVPAASLANAPATPAPADTLFHILVALAAVIVVARALGALFRHLRQPPVIGEVLAGILLGPSLLGRVAPSLASALLPPTVAPYLGALSQVGILLFMFVVGLELDASVLRQRTHAAVAVSHASIIAPFLLGAGLSLGLYPILSTRDVPFSTFALFLGVAMSVTAFPVLARILTDRGLHTSRLGIQALTCACIDDVTAWCMLAFLVGVAKSDLSSAVRTPLLSLGYAAAMIFVARPAVARYVRRYEHLSRIPQDVLAVAFVALLLSSLATELIGIHALFGAFLLGAIVPHDSRVAREIIGKLEDVVVVLFLPAFFAFTGMRTEIGLVHGAQLWLICGAIILLASVGKFGGTVLAARATGSPWRDAAALGILMNTRGLMELVVLNLGLDLRILSPALFAMMVIMAIVTTFATSPILHLLTRGEALTVEPGTRTA